MNTRLVAVRVLSRVLQNGESLTAALDGVFQRLASGPETAPVKTLQTKDKAFVQALCYGVCRYYHRLDFMLTALLAKPLKDMEIKALLLAGLYQLSFMRVKPHAAVSETVSAIRNKPWAKALINAVLRNYLRERDALEAKADRELSARFSHPDWLIGKIMQDWPDQAAECLLANNEQPPMALRVNLAKIGRDDYQQLLIRQGLNASPIGFCPAALILDSPVPVDLLPGFAEGLVSVQDVAAQLAAGLLEVHAGLRVLDVCAAPGGKAAHILEQQAQLHELVAVDIDQSRMQRTADNLQRLGLQARLIIGDATRPEDWWDGKPFDRILLDAPCSASGVIRPAVCRKAYIHPEVLHWLERLADPAQVQALLQCRWVARPPVRAGLSVAERRFVGLLGSPRSARRRGQRATSAKTSSQSATKRSMPKRSRARR